MIGLTSTPYAPRKVVKGLPKAAKKAKKVMAEEVENSDDEDF